MIEEIIVDTLTRMSADFIMQSLPSTLYPKILSVIDDSIVKNQDVGTETERVNVNLTELFKVLSDNSSRADYADNIAQRCKKYATGINMRQMMMSNVMIENIVRSAIDVFDDIKNSCSGNSGSLTLTRKLDGIFIIEDPSPQIRGIVADCVSRVIERSNSSLLSDVKQELKYYASLSDNGRRMFSMLTLIGIASLCIKYTNKYSFLTMLAIGILLIISSTKNDMILYNFSDTILSNYDVCKNTDSYETKDTSNVYIALRDCLENPDCHAFDYRHDDTGTSYSRFYRDTGDGCKPNITGASFVKEPALNKSDGEPTTNSNHRPGDIYIDKLTSVWYQMDRNKRWQKKSRLIDEEISRVTISRLKPYMYVDDDDEESEYYIQYDISEWIVYHVVDKRWVEMYRRKGPELFVHAPQSDVSGFKVTKTDKWTLYTGIVMVISGLIGLFILSQW